MGVTALSLCPQEEPSLRVASGTNRHQRLPEKSGRDGVEQIAEGNSVCRMLMHRRAQMPQQNGWGRLGVEEVLGERRCKSPGTRIAAELPDPPSARPSLSSPVGTEGVRLLQRSHGFADPPPSLLKKI